MFYGDILLVPGQNYLGHQGWIHAYHATSYY